jgi:hypothetical protein
VCLTNSLLVNVTNFAYASNDQTNQVVTTNVVLTNLSMIFQPVVGGGYYLATNTYRASGTANLGSNLRAQLRQKTTHAPIAFTNDTFTSNVVFSLQATRDTNSAPDLGYHYDPIDFVFGGVISEGDLAFDPGVVAAWFPATDNAEPFVWAWGIHESDTNTSVSFSGQADARCGWVQANTVQEDSVAITTVLVNDDETTETVTLTSMVGITGRTRDITADAPQITATFTLFSALGGLQTSHCRDDWGRVRLTARHCELYGGGVGQYASELNFTNCLFHRLQVYALGNYDLVAGLRMQNCTYFGGDLAVNHSRGPTNWYDWQQRGSPSTEGEDTVPWELKHWPVSIRNTAFDATIIHTDNPDEANHPEAADCDYNAFLENRNTTIVVGINSFTNLLSFEWEVGLLGRFYLPCHSPLVDSGGNDYTFAHLDYFTTQTNQVPENGAISNRVDRGYHYPAVDQFGFFYDPDGDGMLDVSAEVHVHFG